MLQYKFKVPFYKYSVRVIALDKDDTFERVSSLLKKEKLYTQDILDGIEKKLKGKAIDGAECISNQALNKIIILLYEQSSKEEFKSSLYHELYHALSAIANGVELEGEEALAYLAGYLYKEGTKIFTDEVINTLIR